MLICDVTDVFVNIFKVCDVVFRFGIACVPYSAMLVSWIYLRMYFYPMHVIKPIYEQGMRSGNEHPVLQKLVPMFLGFLCLLHVLNFFWFYLMIKGATNRFV